MIFRRLFAIMGLLGLPVASVLAAAAGHGGAEGFLSMLPMLIIFIAIFYFLLIRPQSKRAKEHKSLMDDISLGDEVVSIGGIVGKIRKMKDQYIELEIAPNTIVTLQKKAIASVLPKGTVNSAE